MTGFAKGFCVFAFIAVAMMHPNGHWYCTITKAPCPMAEAECCSHSVGDSCESHSGEHQQDPCCIEVDGEWQVVPASALVSLPLPAFFELFAWTGEAERRLPLQTLAASWPYGGIDPPPQQAAAHALFCVQLV